MEFQYFYLYIFFNFVRCLFNIFNNFVLNGHFDYFEINLTIELNKRRRLIIFITHEAE